ncbi:type II toxin-antitoxin system VapC family toxin [Rhodoferax sp.]|uniref:type II toxin-antitoxin system VapC family toxin n=1 Tax=Rhodoferax sp. TaxID=50421 RepID=UPI0025D54A84|nr:type II toxin-antitoxin system VapC family toxin [Rhodoferax sp.]
MAGALVAAHGVLIDSDVLIWFARGNERAVAVLQTIAEGYISAVSYMELVQGCRNKAELKVVQKAFKLGEHDVLPVTTGISDLACKLVEQYALSHSVFVADALIAATAMSHNLVLLSANEKHFSAIKGLKLQVFRV